MKRSETRILTTHVGSLPRPTDLIELYGRDAPDAELLPRLRSAVADVVKEQRDSGVDVVNDGEYGKAMRASVDFGAWWSYVYPRLGGFETRREGPQGFSEMVRGSRDRADFAQFYVEDGGLGQATRQQAPEARAGGGAPRGSGAAVALQLNCTGPVRY
ncbi:MAG: hypothetical protein J2P28_25140, partial [Actinobacteria bacterium]|nr:hypothetical protein [Actinomycetota bacterium]